ncbi:circadian clock-controlled protein [Sergentomyia squamirostris]
MYLCATEDISRGLTLLVILSAFSTIFASNVPQFKEKPNWLLTCPRENPNQDSCFKKLFEAMFTKLAGGLPEVEIAPFEPLKIQNVQISKGMGSLTLAGGFQDLLVRGPSNGTVRRALLNLKDKTLDFDLELPLLRINATYNLKGNVLLLPLVGDGDVKMALKDVRSNVVTKISIKSLPEEVIQIDEMKVQFLIGGMKIHLDNLFNGNKILGASLNLFLNQNANEIIAELRNDLENGLSKIFITLWNNVFSRMPLKLWLK